MSCFIYSWKLLSENSQAPYEQIHSTFLLTAPLPLKIQEVQVPPFLPTLKIFSVPPTRPPYRKGEGHYDWPTASQSWICCKDCFTILHNERG